MQMHTIQFRDQRLICVEHQNELFVAMKPIVEGMGMKWKNQHKKMVTCVPLKGDAGTEEKRYHHNGDAELFFNRFRVQIFSFKMPHDNQSREHIFMPLRRLNGWLMTISANRVKPAIRNTVIAYQQECDEVLFKHFAAELHAETAATQQALNTLKAAVFKQNPAWPLILQGKAQGQTHAQICQLTGHKDPGTIRRNLRRMERFGLFASAAVH
jgi:hypothetical protein